MSEEPLQLLEEVLIDTLRQVSVTDLPDELDWWALDDKVPLEIRTHPFLDRILYHLGQKNMFCGDFVRAQQYLDQLIASRERIYGEGSFNLLKPMETVAQVLRLQNKPNECQVVIDSCLQVIAKLLGEPLPEAEESKQPKTEEIKEEETETTPESHDPIKNPN